MNEKQKIRLLVAEYTAIHVFYWCSCCFISAYASVYLFDKGFTGTQYGLILALGNLGSFFLAPLLSSLVDRSEKISVYHILYALFSGEAVLELLLIRYSGLNPATGILYVLLLICTIAISPMIISLCFEMDHTGKYLNYGFSRSLGTVFYIPVTYFTGQFCTRFSVDILPICALILIAAQFVVLTVTLLLQNRFEKPEFIRSCRMENKEKALSLPEFIRINRKFFVFCCGTALLHFSLSLIGSFMIILIENAGGTAKEMGVFSAVTALAEVPMMLFYTRLTRNFHCSSTIRLAACMCVIRLAAYAFADTLPLMYILCITETFSYALLTPALVDYNSLVIPYKDMSKGQSLSFSMLTLGGVFACQLGGIMYDTLSVCTTLLIGTVVAVIGTAICWFSVDFRKA